MAETNSDKIARLQEELDEVREAIRTIVTGAQSHGVQGRSVQFAELETLQKRERYLEGQLARAERGGGVRVRYGVPT